MPCNWVDGSNVSVEPATSVSYSENGGCRFLCNVSDFYKIPWHDITENCDMNTHHHKNLKSYVPGISKVFVNVQIRKNNESRLLDWTRQKYH
jgi:hypothetical protein